MGQQSQGEFGSMVEMGIPMGGVELQVELIEILGILDTLPGHHMKDRANAFILFTPGWVSWSSSKTN